MSFSACMTSGLPSAKRDAAAKELAALEKRRKDDYRLALVSALMGLERFRIPVWDQFKDCRHIVIVACGTSFHAGSVGRYVFERLTEVDVEVEIASEFRYRKLNFPPNTLSSP